MGLRIDWTAEWLKDRAERMPTEAEREDNWRRLSELADVHLDQMRKRRALSIQRRAADLRALEAGE